MVTLARISIHPVELEDISFENNLWNCDLMAKNLDGLNRFVMLVLGENLFWHLFDSVIGSFQHLHKKHCSQFILCFLCVGLTLGSRELTDKLMEKFFSLNSVFRQYISPKEDLFHLIKFLGQQDPNWENRRLSFICYSIQEVGSDHIKNDAGLLFWSSVSVSSNI